MTSNLDISVVMGVYNGENYLAQTIDSLLQQHSVQFELILVDDGSNEATRNCLAAFAQQDTRVRVVNQERGGLTRALVLGCELARGRYIARQDNGDVSMPERLAEQQRVLDHNERLSFVSCWTEVCGPEEEYLNVIKGTAESAQARDVVTTTTPSGLLDGPTSHPSVTMRRDAYQKAGGYRPQFYFAQDWDLWARLAEVGQFQTVQQTLYRSRVMPDSLSGRYRAEQEAIVRLSHQSTVRRRAGLPDDDLLAAASQIRPGVRKPLTKQQMAGGYYFIGEQLRRNADKRARPYLRRAVQLQPLHWRAWTRLTQFQLQQILKA